MKISVEGKQYEFPDGTTDEEINQALGSSASQQSQQMQQPMQSGQQNPISQRDQFKQAVGTRSKPFDNIRDILGGLAKGSQNVAGFLGQGGQAIASLLTGGYAPKVDINEEIGLGNENPVDLQKMISSKNPNALLQMIGQYAPAAALGGASIPGQVASQGLYGASQAKPGNRLYEGALSSLGTGALGYGGKLANKYIPKLINYLQPSKSTNEFLSKLGGKIPSTNDLTPSDVNSERIAETIKTSVDNKKFDALSHKNKVLNKIGNTKVSQLPGFDINRVAEMFNPNELKPSKMKSFNKIYNDYVKDQNFNRFLNRSENLFGNEVPVRNHDKLLDLISSREINFGSNKSLFSEYDKRLNNLSDKFLKNKSLKNADSLIKELNDRIYNYKSLQEKDMLHPKDASNLKDLIESKKDLLSDIETHMEHQSPELRNEYKTYREKWAKNVEPYYSKPALAKISQGQTEGIKPSEYRSVFANPTKKVKRILADLPSETKNHIIFNELTNIKPGDSKGLSNALHELRQSKGYSTLITPEIRGFEKKLNNQLKVQKLLKYGGIGATGLGTLIGGYSVLKPKKSSYNPMDNG